MRAALEAEGERALSKPVEGAQSVDSKVKSLERLYQTFVIHGEEYMALECRRALKAEQDRVDQQQ